MDTSWDMKTDLAKIKVIGVGGGGSNAVNRMIEEGVSGVDFIAVNTDAQALALSNAPTRVRIGGALTKGLGSGGYPAVGAKAAEESRTELRTVLEGADMVFVTAGMGGGTGTGASPLVATIAQEVGALTVAIVTRPFGFEGKVRAANAEDGIKKLSEHVDALIVINNDRLLDLVGKSVSFLQACRLADDILRQGIQGIAEYITVPYEINVDFADVRAIMTKGGSALMSIGQATGEDRAVQAARQAISSPLLDADISGATGVLFTVRGGEDMSITEVSEAAELIRQMAAPDANLIFGAGIDPLMKDYFRVTLFATGFTRGQAVQTRPGQQPATIITQAPPPVSAPVPQPMRSTPQPAPQPSRNAPPPTQQPARAPATPAQTPVAPPARQPAPVDIEIPAFLRKKRD